MRACAQLVRLHLSNNYKPFKYSNLTSFIGQLTRFNESFHADNGKDYTLMVETIRVTIVQEPSGGCNSSGKDKHMEISGKKITIPRSSNNNCLFACLKKELGLKKITKGVCNTMRRDVGILNKNSITASQAIKIFDKFKVDQNAMLRIFVDVTGDLYESTPLSENEDPENGGIGRDAPSLASLTILTLSKSHYVREDGDAVIEKKCPKCLKSYKHEHTCNRKRIQYVDAKFRGMRSLLTKVIKAKHNNQRDVLHYDIESHRDEYSIHTPYIVGYVFRGQYIRSSLGRIV